MPSPLDKVYSHLNLELKKKLGDHLQEMSASLKERIQEKEKENSLLVEKNEELHKEIATKPLKCSKCKEHFINLYNEAHKEPNY